MKTCLLATGMSGMSGFERKYSNVQPIYLTNALCVLYETVYGKRNCKEIVNRRPIKFRSYVKLDIIIS